MLNVVESNGIFSALDNNDGMLVVGMVEYNEPASICVCMSVCSALQDTPYDESTVILNPILILL